MRASEVTGVARLLEADHESAEDAARAIIKWLDTDRGKRVDYIAVMQFGERCPFYVSLGPYPGRRSAAKAAQAHPAAGEAFKIVVLPVVNPAALSEMLRNLDSPPKRA